MPLHRTLSIFIVAAAILAVGAGLSLVLLTTYLHRATVDLERGLHAVRLAEEIQIDLLKYPRTRDALEREEIEGDLHDKLSQARRYAETPQENHSLSETDELLDLYFANAPSGDGSTTVNAALASLEKFVKTNIEQADESMAESERLDAIGDRIGIAVAIALVIGTITMLIWLGTTAFRPVFEIRNAMHAFAAGDKGARVAINGPEELRGIAGQFNEMADALARQHHNQAVFLAAVAHDLRNPITGLKMAAEVLSGAVQVDPDKLAGLMEVIKRQGGSLDRMVGDLLDSARIESGQLDLRFEEVDARSIANDCFDLFCSVSKVHEFHLMLPKTPVWMDCDRIRIEQVLNNLLSNAIKYSPGGGSVTLKLEATADEALFQVSDEGLGIAKDDVPYIFEPFRRVRTGKEDIPGIGLGLSVARRIVLAHRGRIDVQSERSMGTTFRVHLPARVLQQASA
jgi:signal transduction histidine kinase